MSEYPKLDELKVQKQEAKNKLKLIEGCINEQLDTAKDIASEYEEINADRSVEVTEYVEAGVMEEAGLDSRFVGDDGGVGSADDSEMDVDVATGNGESLPINYAEFTHLSVKEKVKCFGIERGMEAFGMVQNYFKGIGYNASFSETYDESRLLEEVVREVEIDEKPAVIAESIVVSGTDYASRAVENKASLMLFEDGDNNYNLSMYLAVIKKLGIEMSIEERYEDYQGIYDEKMRCGISLEVESQKQNIKKL